MAFRARGSTRSLTLGALAALCVAGCSSADATRTGDLGRGRFGYRCISAADVACMGTDDTADTFPTSIGVGSQFELLFEVTREQERVGNPRIRSASAEYLESLGENGFIARKPGIASIYAQASTDGKLVDFTSIRVKPLSRLGIVERHTSNVTETTTDTPIGATIDLKVGDRPLWTSRPFGPRDEPLAGVIKLEWTSSDAAIVQVETQGPAPEVTLNALAAGTATITVTDGTVQTTTNVTVTP